MLVAFILAHTYTQPFSVGRENGIELLSLLVRPSMCFVSTVLPDCLTSGSNVGAFRCLFQGPAFSFPCGMQSCAPLSRLHSLLQGCHARWHCFCAQALLSIALIFTSVGGDQPSGSVQVRACALHEGAVLCSVDFPIAELCLLRLAEIRPS